MWRAPSEATDRYTGHYTHLLRRIPDINDTTMTTTPKVAANLIGALGSAVRDGLRYVAHVPEGERYFNRPWQYLTRPAASVLMPNFGTLGNTIRAGAIGTEIYRGGQEMDKRVQNARQTLSGEAAKLPGGDTLSQGIMDRTTYPELGKSLFRTVTGTGDPNDPVRRAEDALSSKVLQLGASQGLQDWSRSPYTKTDALAGLWAPLAKKYLAGRVGNTISNASTFKDEASRIATNASGAAAKAVSPSGDTGVLDSLGKKLGPAWKGLKGWTSEHSAEIPSMAAKARDWGTVQAKSLGGSVDDVLQKKVMPFLTSPSTPDTSQVSTNP